LRRSSVVAGARAAGGPGKEPPIPNGKPNRCLNFLLFLSVSILRERVPRAPLAAARGRALARDDLRVSTTGAGDGEAPFERSIRALPQRRRYWRRQHRLPKKNLPVPVLWRGDPEHPATPGGARGEARGEKAARVRGWRGPGDMSLLRRLHQHRLLQRCAGCARPVPSPRMSPL
jgi:hypothetical protein